MAFQVQIYLRKKCMIRLMRKNKQSNGQVTASNGLVLSLPNGFTLIELLVSISIIAILTTILTANFVGARQRGQDGKRKGDVKAIQQALELYRADEGQYPEVLPACGEQLLSDNATYMKQIPCDPDGETSYQYISDGVTYDLFACLQNTQDSEATDNDTALANSDCDASRAVFWATSP